VSDRYRIEHGDCLGLLKREPANSWDGMVTDPPGAISFMGRAWDSNKGGRKQWCRFMAQRFKAAVRVLKPGAHALVWALPRTSHWTGCALEDAGFEIRDGVSHAFGSGFPKSHNLPGGLGTALKPSHEIWFLVRKPLERGLTIEQNHAKWGTGVLNIDGCRVAHASSADRAAHDAQVQAIKTRGGSMENSWKNSSDLSGANDVSDAGRWPTNLVLTHDARCVCVGTRAVKANPTWDTPNRDTAPSAFTGSEVSKVRHANGRDGEASAESRYGESSADFAMTPGQRRDAAEDVPVWECVEGCPVLLLDLQSGELNSHGGAPRAKVAGWGRSRTEGVVAIPNDNGAASRYFPQFQWDPELDDLEPFIYAAKASRGERDKGLENFRQCSAVEAQGREQSAIGSGPRAGSNRNGGASNVHPTVKSIELIRYFVRLVTPRNGTERPKVGDIFTGSGTGGVAALLEGCDFVGFELNDTDAEPFVSIARARCEHVVGGSYVPRASLRAEKPPAQPSLFERTA